VAAALAPRPLRLEGLVDGRNCPVAEADLRKWLAPTVRVYTRQGERLVLAPSPGGDAGEWLAAALKE
jgi:hypothetical protein